MKTLKYLIILVLSSFVFSSCNTKQGEYNETETRGKVKITVDESFKLINESEVFTFASIYKYAEIISTYKPEYDVLDDFMKDSVRTIITCKKLTTEQEDYLKSINFIPKTTTIAYDAVAFFVNKNNTDTLLKINQLLQIFEGKITDWNQITNTSKLGKIQVVFDNIKSANARFIQEKYNLTNFPDFCFTANSNEEVVKYVEEHQNAIGIISVNWISDSKDSISNKFLENIKVVALTNAISPEGPYYYRPYQAYIADKSYPFIREVYMITRQTYRGLEAGYISFVAGEKGQRIILKSGLVPATAPIRIVELKSE